MPTPESNRLARLALLLPAATGIAGAAPTGFSAPAVIVYGKVGTPAGIPLYSGTLEWTITPPAGGTPFKVTGPLSNVGGNTYSYRIDFPTEKAPGGFVLSGDSLEAATTAKSYTLSATLDATPVALALPNGAAHPGSTSQAELFRGRTERIDIVAIGLTDLDSDNDGIPDDWERRWAPITNPLDPDDAVKDPDGDGLTNYEEYTQDADPTCHEYSRWAATNGLNSPALAATDADPDHDGMSNVFEYALGGDPRTPDVATVMARIDARVEQSPTESFLSLTVTRPGFRQCHADFLVETTGNLSLWSSASTAVTTLIDQPTLLKSRDTVRFDSSTANRRFIRLRIAPKS